LPGCPGIACFELSASEDFEDSFKTEWIEAVPEYDFIVKTKVDGLKPDTRYYYRLLYGPNPESIDIGNTCTFKTLSGRMGEEEVSFVVVTGMNHYFFHHGNYDPKGAYKGADKHLGYPGLEAILKLKPDFFVGTGDNVYYDHPGGEASARTQAELRRKWHEQFILPRFVNLFSRIPTYWEKDDHDHRYDDCDPYGDKEPSNELGIATFLEQVPVVDPKDENPITYRTHRINKHLQIWLVEGRDYRSPNKMADGPEKTIWGKEQNEWLRRTLLESDAAFKILISPTPIIGPDRSSKRDNHTNPEGFIYEGRQFIRWLADHDSLRKNLYIVCGDRHWQYHSVDPSGFEEFSCGALVDANAIRGTWPGDPKSNDPEGKIRQPFHPEESSGGFLMITVRPGVEDEAPTAEFSFFDEKGMPLYSVSK
jgi:alkaline phosphatase/alkaline phosphatase D